MAANGYYQGGQQMQYPPNDQGGYQQNQSGYLPPQGPPPQQVYNNQPPPTYTQDNGQKYGAAVSPDGSKQTFDQAFKLDRPKYNDLWAGILVRLLTLQAMAQC